MSKANHYPSLELCKKLTEAGFPETEKINLFCGDSWYKIAVFNKELFNSKYDYIFPSVMELLDVLPAEITTEIPVFLSIDKFPTTYWVSYTDNGIHKWAHFEMHDTLPNSLAEMYLFLKENWYIWK